MQNVLQTLWLSCCCKPNPQERKIQVTVECFRRFSISTPLRWVLFPASIDRVAFVALNKPHLWCICMSSGNKLWKSLFDMNHPEYGDGEIVVLDSAKCDSSITGNNWTVAYFI